MCGLFLRKSLATLVGEVSTSYRKRHSSTRRGDGPRLPRRGRHAPSDADARSPSAAPRAARPPSSPAPRRRGAPSASFSGDHSRSAAPGAGHYRDRPRRCGDTTQYIFVRNHFTDGNATISQKGGNPFFHVCARGAAVAQSEFPTSPHPPVLLRCCVPFFRKQV